MAPELSREPFSKETVDIIQRQMNTCLLHHRACIQPSAELPTRLLDLTSLEDGLIRLVESKSLPAERYIALSYCWGKGRTVRTTGRTLAHHKLGLRVSTLQKTIQDAAYMTKVLGCKYLWVDALCIIQDNAEDWEIEASRMASVYRNSYVTIAASSAATADDGFLEHRSPSSVGSNFTMPWSTTEGHSTMIKARVQPRHIWSEVSEPLESRAWTFQERVLSTRVLAFAPQELRWSCKSGQTCECGQWGFEEVPLQSIYGLATKREAYLFWEKIVQIYSARNLTFAKDKLTALSGLAGVFQSILDSSYLAGLWVNNMIAGLSWFGENTQSYSDYVAPSYSWASVEGKVEFRTLNEVQCFLEAAETSLSGQDPFGRVCAGSIKIRGRLVPTTLTIMNFGDVGVRDKRLRLTVYHKSVMFHPDVRIMEHEFVTEDGRRERALCRASFSSIYSPITGDVSPDLLYLGIYRDEKTGECFQIMLVIGKAPQNPKSYQRLGLIRLTYYDSKNLLDLSHGNLIQTITMI